jgi:hypothetical protein
VSKSESESTTPPDEQPPIIAFFATLASEPQLMRLWLDDRRQDALSAYEDRFVQQDAGVQPPRLEDADRAALLGDDPEVVRARIEETTGRPFHPPPTWNWMGI